MDDETLALAPPTRTGRMGLAERQIRQRRFAQLILDVGLNLSRQEVCRRCGISQRTYDRWLADPEVLKLASPDAGEMSAITRAYAYQQRGTALATLVDVMRHSRNDVAKVRAAELMFQIGEAAALNEGGSAAENASEVEQLLTRHSPVLIVGQMNLISSQAGKELIANTSSETSDLAGVIDFEGLAQTPEITDSERYAKPSKLPALPVLSVSPTDDALTTP